MSGNSARKIRRVIADAYSEQIDEINAKAVFEAFRRKINTYPLKTRIKIAFNVLRKKF